MEYFGKVTLCIGLTGLLSACGGGGGDASTPTPPPTEHQPVTALSVATALTNANPGVEIKSAKSSIAFSGSADGEQTLKATGQQFNVSLWSNHDSGRAVMVDDINDLALSVEHATAYHAVRVYKAGVFVGGALSYHRDGDNWVSPMAFEGDTNITERDTETVKTANEPARAVAAMRSVALSVASNSCYNTVSDLTEPPAAFLDDASTVLDETDNLLEKLGKPKLPSIVSRTAQFLGGILSRAASVTCDDAPNPISETQMVVATEIAAHDAVLGTNASEWLSKLKSAADLSTKLQALGSQKLADVISGNQKVAVSNREVVSTGLSGNASTALSARISKFYLPALDPRSCLSGGFTGNDLKTWTDTNTCSYPIIFGYCIGSFTTNNQINKCSIDRMARMEPGGTRSYTVDVESNKVELGVWCEAMHEERNVFVDPEKESCYIWKAVK